MLGQIESFAEDFDINDYALFCRQVLTMLQQRTIATAFFREWKEVKTFAWETRFPEQVPFSLASFLRTPGTWQWHKKIANLRSVVYRIKFLCLIRRLSETEILWMERKLNEVVTRTLNELVTETPNEVVTTTELSEVVSVVSEPYSLTQALSSDLESVSREDGDAESHSTPADDQAASSEMSI